MSPDQKRQEPRLGDFVAKDTKSPVAPEAEAATNASTAKTASAPAPKTELPRTEAEEQAEARAKLYEAMAHDVAPIEDYQAYLKEMDISEDKAAEIVDNLFTKGFHSETYKLTKRLSAVLRTREHGDTLRLQMALEVQRPIFQHVLQEITARYNIAASLERFGDTTFAFPGAGADKEEIEKLFDVRLRFVERMADPAFYKLSTLLAKFDRTTAAVMREGVAENF